MLRGGWGVLGLALLAPCVGAAELKFETQEIDNKLGIGYAVTLADVNNDKKLDIVVVDKTQVVWYENPSWKKRVIVDQGQTVADNVCIAAHDIDGDGQVDFALGSGWRNLSTEASGPIYWLKRGASLDEKWKVYPVADETSIHRIRFADVDGDGKAELLVGPLLGKKSSQARNYMDAPIRVLAYRIPKNPTRDRWEEEVISQQLHVMHNLWPVPSSDGKRMDLLTASYEGVHRFSRAADGKWTALKLGEGNQDNPKSNRGASEIKQGTLGATHPYIATVEPWHGHQIVVYTPPDDPKGTAWDRQVIDDRLKWGHAVWCADLDGDRKEELIIGVRDNLSGKSGEKCGVRVYSASDVKGTKWKRLLVDEGGVAVEDATAGDLDGDGRVDLVAVGRATRNVRIYWNKK